MSKYTGKSTVGTIYLPMRFQLSKTLLMIAFPMLPNSVFPVLFNGERAGKNSCGNLEPCFMHDLCAAVITIIIDDMLYDE